MDLHFTFEAPVLFDPEVEDGYMKHYVPIPSTIAQNLLTAQVTHVEGKLDSSPFRRAVQKRPDGSMCLKFGRSWLADAKLNVDDFVVVELWPDPAPERIELPEELASALMYAPTDVVERWSALSISRQKTFAYHVMRAKRPETRQRRAEAIIHDLTGNEDDSDPEELKSKRDQGE